MPRHIPEPDWQAFRRLHKVALERYAEESLAMIADIQAAHEEDPHKTFQKLFQLINDRNKGVSRLFDDFRRSTALISLLGFKMEGLLTEAEITEFSEETRKWLREVSR